MREIKAEARRDSRGRGFGPSKKTLLQAKGKWAPAEGDRGGLG